MKEYYIIGDGKKFFHGFWLVQHMLIKGEDEAWRFESLEEAQEWLEQFKEDRRLPPGTRIYKVTHNIEAV